MKLQSKFLVASLLAATVAVSSLSAMAGSCEKSHEKSEAFTQELLDKVSASKDQRQQIETMNQQFKTQIEPMKESIMDKKQALMEYVASPQADQAQALKQEEEVMALTSQVGRMMIEHTFTQKAVLTPEQQQKASEFVQQKTDKWEDKMDKKEMDKKDKMMK